MVRVYEISPFGAGKVYDRNNV